MKTRLLFILMALMSLTLVAPAQTKTSAHKTKAAVAKKLPPRDAKGRFVKKSEKKLPPRDPKTGRFMKKADAKKTEHKGPARDPKTGRFIKKKG